MATPSRLFVMQMQDILELGEETRINAPGSLGGNWQWRMRPEAIDGKLAKRLHKLTETYRRL
jgi:4-alpha-glucanotransferase